MVAELLSCFPQFFGTAGKLQDWEQLSADIIFLGYCHNCDEDIFYNVIMMVFLLANILMKRNELRII